MLFDGTITERGPQPTWSEIDRQSEQHQTDLSTLRGQDATERGARRDHLGDGVLCFTLTNLGVDFYSAITVHTVLSLLLLLATNYYYYYHHLLTHLPTTYEDVLRQHQPGHGICFPRADADLDSSRCPRESSESPSP